MRRNTETSISIEDLKERIEAFLLGLRRPILSEPGRDFVDLTTSNYSFDSQYNKLLWHIWNDQTNLVRQITGIHKESANRMELRYQKFGKGPPGSLVVADSKSGSEQMGRKAARVRFALSLKRYLSQLFPGWNIDDLHTEPDLHHSFSGRYTRCVLAKGQQTWAVIGCSEHEGMQTTEDILTYGLLWLDWLRNHETDSVCEGLRIFLPPGRSDTSLQRMSALNSEIAKWELYETGTEIKRLDRKDVGNLRTNFAIASSLPNPRKTNSDGATDYIEIIRRINPDIVVTQGVEDRLALSLNGLVFARETQNGIAFRVGREQTPLKDDNFDQLKRLIQSISRIRSARSDSSQHPYYRLQPERWMQSAIVRQIELLSLDLDPTLLYEQVPATSGIQHGLIDLMGITARGRLVVAEFKASEDIHLPLQALEYWIRLRWQQQSGELQRMGYFPNRVISRESPLLALICPALQFHSTTDTVTKYFAPEIDIIKIGLNEEWRNQIQVLFRNRRTD